MFQCARDLVLSCELQVGAVLALVLYELHLVRRLWECVNVHVFSCGTMHITHYLFGSPTNDVTRDSPPSVRQLHKLPELLLWFSGAIARSIAWRLQALASTYSPQ